jgi:inward rectifier potassium channel
MAPEEAIRPAMANTETPSDRGGSDVDLNLGFGKFVSARIRRRLLNRDGTFNVRRTGLGFFERVSVYHFLLEISWPRFLGLAAVWYILANAVFAAVIVTLKSLVGFLSLGLAAGLMFARFARPNARIIFSRNAVIAPYRGGKGFEFRIINSRKSQIVELAVHVILARRDAEGGVRSYHELSLERERVAIFPLAWTIVQAIDDSSPLAGVSLEDLEACEGEFLVLLTGFDEAFAQTVPARSSYRTDELVYGARFASMFDHDESTGLLGVDLARIHDVHEPAPL